MFKIITDGPFGILNRTRITSTGGRQVAASIWSGEKEELTTVAEAEQVAKAIADYLTAKRNGQSVCLEVVSKTAPCQEKPI